MQSENNYPEQPILMVDDQPAWLRSMAMSLKVSAGITNIHKCSDSREVEVLLETNKYSLILLDLTMPHIGGETLLTFISEKYPEIPVIVISGVNQIEIAIRCVRLGAEDFFVKTDDRERVVSGISRTLKKNQLQQENSQLSDRLLYQSRIYDPAFSRIITSSVKMHGIFSYLIAIANSPEPILIVGESGTGKELVAQALHQLRCPEKPWVAINVAGLDDMVFSDTLFGHVKGAYTGAEQHRKGMIEEAADGTIFLDEIGDLSMASQVKLLRLLQEREYYPLGSDQPRMVKAHILVATNQSLSAKESEGTFRRDLHYRLGSHRVEIPPLRKRKEDLPSLIDFFLAEAAESFGKNKPTTPPELLPLLSTYHFPGNIRELRAMIFDAVSLHKGGVLSLSSFKKFFKEDQESNVFDSGEAKPAEEKIIYLENLPTLKESNRLLIEEAMRRSRGKQAIAARMLGISRQALNQRLMK
ncbi:MAG: sigma-54-dependent Fis family transcriptional regulator [Desulfuromusa sp.]|nr:sigma-54-dependent Fis family transcriptional regulator [Desulfuromusa sp.]